MDRKSYWNIEKAEEERLAGNENFKKGNYPDADGNGLQFIRVWV